MWSYNLSHNILIIFAKNHQDWFIWPISISFIYFACVDKLSMFLYIYSYFVTLSITINMFHIFLNMYSYIITLSMTITSHLIFSTW